MTECLVDSCPLSVDPSHPLCVIYCARAQLTTNMGFSPGDREDGVCKGRKLQLYSNTTVQPYPNVTLYPAAYPSFILALRICAGTTCVLSIFDGLWIVIAHACFLRPKPAENLKSAEATRDQLHQIIVFLSIADILVAWGHLWGVTTHLERFLDVYSHYNKSAPYCIYANSGRSNLTVEIRLLEFSLIQSNGSPVH